MSAKSYKQFCGVAKALDVVGERWTLLIVRDLLLGPRRFTDLVRLLRGLTPNLLSKRLRELADAGIIEQRPGRDYQLTAHGRSLEPVVLALGAFGARYLAVPAEDEQVDPRWFMVSLKRRYLGSPQQGAIALHFADEHFYVKFGGSSIEVRDSVNEPVDATLSGSPEAWFPLISRQATFRELESAGRLSRTGPARPALALLKALGMRV